MDIARPVLCRPGEEKVDQFDDRGVARLVEEISRLLDLRDEAVRRLVVHLLEKLLGRAPAEVVGKVDRRMDRLLGRKDHRPLRPAEEAAEVVHRREIRGVVHRHDESLRRIEGNDLLLFQVLDGDEAREVGFHVVRGKRLPERNAVLGAQGRKQLRLGKDLLLDKEIDHPRAVRPGQLPHFGKDIGGHAESRQTGIEARRGFTVCR